MSTQEIVALALKLNPAERFELVDQVLHSLNKPDPEIDRVWQEEALHRVKALDEGRLTTVSMEEVFRDL